VVVKKKTKSGDSHKGEIVKSHRKSTRQKLPEDLSMLDDLIKRCYRELLRSVEENAKLGDFIKMIELRRKIAPDDSNQKKFWTMLEKVRRETLPVDRKTSPKKNEKKTS